MLHKLQWQECGVTIARHAKTEIMQAISIVLGTRVKVRDMMTNHCYSFHLVRKRRIPI